MQRSRLRAIGSVLLSVLLVVATTAQQALGIVSTVSNLVDIVEGRNTAPVQVNQPIVEGATYRSTGQSAAEFSFPDGLRAAAGPSSSIAFHPAASGGGSRLVSVSEGLFRFQLPNQGSRVDVQTPFGAFRAVSTAPNSEILVRVDAGGKINVAATRGRVELRNFSTGALLLLLQDGQGASLVANPGAGPLGVTVAASGPIAPEVGTELASLDGLLRGQVAGSAAPVPGGAAGDAAASNAGESNGAVLGWTLGGLALVGGVVAAAVSGGNGHHSSSTTTTAAAAK